MKACYASPHLLAASCAGNKAPSQMTEEEWLKRQEGLERRRMRSLRDKREAEETIKAKLRKAVTVRFRGKLGTAGGGEGSGTEDGAAGGTRGAVSQVRGHRGLRFTYMGFVFCVGCGFATLIVRTLRASQCCHECSLLSPKPLV
jgi:hypothetical protein